MSQRDHICDELLIEIALAVIGQCVRRMQPAPPELQLDLSASLERLRELSSALAGQRGGQAP